MFLHVSRKLPFFGGMLLPALIYFLPVVFILIVISVISLVWLAYRYRQQKIISKHREFFRLGLITSKKQQRELKTQEKDSIFPSLSSNSHISGCTSGSVDSARKYNHVNTSGNSSFYVNHVSCKDITKKQANTSCSISRTSVRHRTYSRHSSASLRSVRPSYYRTPTSTIVSNGRYTEKSLDDQAPSSGFVTLLASTLNSNSSSPLEYQTMQTCHRYPTHQPQYGGVGVFPTVRLNKTAVPVLLNHKLKMSRTMKLSSPDVQNESASRWSFIFSTNEKEKSTEDPCDPTTVIAALKRRKRNLRDKEDSSSNEQAAKRQRRDSNSSAGSAFSPTNTNYMGNTPLINPSPGTLSSEVLMHRRNDNLRRPATPESPLSFRSPAKYARGNAIFSSYSSSRFLTEKFDGVIKQPIKRKIHGSTSQTSISEPSKSPNSSNISHDIPDEKRQKTDGSKQETDSKESTDAVEKDITEGNEQNLSVSHDTPTKIASNTKVHKSAQSFRKHSPACSFLNTSSFHQMVTIPAHLPTLTEYNKDRKTDESRLYKLLSGVKEAFRNKDGLSLPDSVTSSNTSSVETATITSTSIFTSVSSSQPVATTSTTSNGTSLSKTDAVLNESSPDSEANVTSSSSMTVNTISTSASINSDLNVSSAPSGIVSTSVVTSVSSPLFVTTSNEKKTVPNDLPETSVIPNAGRLFGGCPSTTAAATATTPTSSINTSHGISDTSSTLVPVATCTTSAVSSPSIMFNFTSVPVSSGISTETTAPIKESTGFSDNKVVSTVTSDFSNKAVSPVTAASDKSKLEGPETTTSLIKNTDNKIPSSSGFNFNFGEKTGTFLLSTNTTSSLPKNSFCAPNKPLDAKIFGTPSVVKSSSETASLIKTVPETVMSATSTVCTTTTTSTTKEAVTSTAGGFHFSFGSAMSPVTTSKPFQFSLNSTQSENTSLTNSLKPSTTLTSSVPFGSQVVTQSIPNYVSSAFEKGTDSVSPTIAATPVSTSTQVSTSQSIFGSAVSTVEFPSPKPVFGNSQTQNIFNSTQNVFGSVPQQTNSIVVTSQQSAFTSTLTNSQSPFGSSTQPQSTFGTQLPENTVGTASTQNIFASGDQTSRIAIPATSSVFGSSQNPSPFGSGPRLFGSNAQSTSFESSTQMQNVFDNQSFGSGKSSQSAFGTPGQNQPMFGSTNTAQNAFGTPSGTSNVFGSNLGQSVFGSGSGSSNASVPFPMNSNTTNQNFPRFSFLQQSPSSSPAQQQNLGMFDSAPKFNFGPQATFGATSATPPRTTLFSIGTGSRTSEKKGGPRRRGPRRP